ncbi:sigma 54-interacting transcriptional regulator [Brevibacillus composti]|uniref:Sigma 54-interacting transcriptional regulator n=1 Tax=Brevibacillus composti TaxID=2796470 RepID=A0A7T5JQ80_9BACL|nr:sigma 54-interacting transcriptional regulator [Brevibacillus composti]QQE76198.1 sigma 54-interacting transcriptional regulator [Brevibacillus composti]QUO43227.1 sigma 54-interacting transcriptional regulator [Brevibacillus composti]
MELKLSEFLETIPYGIVIVDREGLITQVNAAGSQLLGLKREELISRPITSIAPGSDMLQVMRQGMASLRREIQFGEKRFLVDRLPIVVGGEVIGGLSLFQMVPGTEGMERRWSEQERELHQFKELVEQLYDGIVMCDKNGIITMINKSYCDFLGTTIEEAIGRHITEVIENTRMHVVIKTGKAEIDQLMRIGDREIIVSRMPLKEGDETVGALGKVVFSDLRELRSIVERYNIMERQLDFYRQELKRMVGAKYSFAHIMAEHPLMKDAVQMAKRIAQTKSSVLILGESGTGKELFAHAIHEESNRSEGAFVRVNCAAIPKDLMEAELFGYEEGAFTGAKKGGKPGKIELANQGTLFLDEIGDMPLDMQAKLLRVLQEREVERIGATRPISVDIRVIAATHRPLEKLIKEGEFREDLYYRLNVFMISLPPLRVQGQTILTLADGLIKKLNAELYTNVTGISERVKDIFLAHPWPGNLREMNNVLERAVQLAEDGVLEPEHLPPYLLDKQVLRGSDSISLDLEAELAKTEKRVLEAALAQCEGNKVQAAQLLGIHRASLYRKLEKHRIAVNESIHG